MNFLTVSKYAEKMAVAPGTVYDWIKLGLPYTRHSERGTRIIVEQADQWHIDHYGELTSDGKRQRVAKLVEIK
jgi:hypothetical protein